MKQQVELLQNESNRLKLGLIELLSVKQINTSKIRDNTENLGQLKTTGKSKRNKLNHQQDYRIPLSNSFETSPIEEY